MDGNRMQESQNIESMRKMLLIQEEIFKHQVQELHRLYTLQKHLMQELENGLTSHRKAKTTHADVAVQLTSSSPSSMHQQSGHNSNFHDFIARVDGPKETSGCCSGDHNEKDLKIIEEGNDVEVELTLSIGHSDRSHREQLGHSSRKTSNGIECGESGFYREKTRPHWLLQDLSLHRT